MGVRVGTSVGSLLALAFWPGLKVGVIEGDAVGALVVCTPTIDRPFRFTCFVLLSDLVIVSVTLPVGSATTAVSKLRSFLGSVPFVASVSVFAPGEWSTTK